MVRVLYILGTCAIVAAGSMCGLWLTDRREDSAWVGGAQGCANAVRLLKRQDGESGAHLAEVPPLVAQAEAFARLLVPPKPPEDKPALSVQTANPVSTVSPTHPPTLLTKFRLYGTSCYPSQPGRSMALISELGSLEGSERWVKEGAQVGHFVIHEIRADGIVYRDGDQLREMAAETVAGPTRLVQDIRRGSRRVSAVVEDVGIMGTSPAGPNSIEITGN